MRRECSECSLVVVSRGLVAMKGINKNTEKLETYSDMRESCFSCGPKEIKGELFSAVNQLSFLKCRKSDLYT